MTHRHDHDHDNDQMHDACCGGGASFDPARRMTLDMLAGGGLAALMASLGLPAAAQSTDDETLRIGYLPITDATALLVAHAKGFFEDEGIKAEKPVLIRSWPALVEGFVTKKFNMVHFLKPIPIWMRYNNKVPVKVMAWAHTNGSAMVVGGETDIHDFKDLGGKQIAVPFWYSMHNIVLQYALRQVGLKPVIKAAGEPLAADECNLQILAPADMPPALAAKKIDGFIVAEPFAAMGEVMAKARMLRFTGDIWKNHPCCVVCMHEADTQTRPEWTQKAINAVVRGAIYASQNKEEVAVLLSKDGQGYLPPPAAVVKRAMTLYADNPEYIQSGAIRNEAEFHNGRIDFQPWPYPSATKLFVEAMRETKVAGDDAFLKDLDPEFVAKDLVNYDFIKAACDKFPDWTKDPSVSTSPSPYEREELLKL